MQGPPSTDPTLKTPSSTTRFGTDHSRLTTPSAAAAAHGWLRVTNGSKSSSSAGGFPEGTAIDSFKGTFSSRLKISMGPPLPILVTSSRNSPELSGNQATLSAAKATQNVTSEQRSSSRAVPHAASDHGIIPRAAHDLFARLRLAKAAAAARATAARGGVGSSAAAAGPVAGAVGAAVDDDDVKVVCSYLEIYQDKPYDLLQPYKKGVSR